MCKTEGFWGHKYSFLLKDLCMDLLALTPSELQHWGSSSKGTRNVRVGTELSGIKEKAGGTAFSQTKVLTEAIASFLSPPHNRVCRSHICISFHQPAYHCSPCPSDSLRPCTTQLLDPSKLFPVICSCKWPFLAHASHFPKISHKSIISPQPALCLLLSGPRHSTSSSQPWFAAWPFFGTSKSNTSSSHLQISLQLMPGGPGQSTGASDLGLKLSGGPRASTASAQLQTMS